MFSIQIKTQFFVEYCLCQEQVNELWYTPSIGIQKLLLRALRYCMTIKIKGENKSTHDNLNDGGLSMKF